MNNIIFNQSAAAADGIHHDSPLYNPADAPILIYIDMTTAMYHGIEFFLSDNGLIVSPGIRETGAIPLSFAQAVIFKPTGGKNLPHTRPGCQRAAVTGMP